MLFRVVFIASCGIALLRGGRLSNLRDLPVRQLWLFFIPVVLQIVIFGPLATTFGLSESVIRAVYLASMAMAGVALWLNRHLPGMGLITAGFILNLAVIGLNGGFMPVSNPALEFAGYPTRSERYANGIPITDSTILPWLGDVLPLPWFLPIRGVFSIGDILILIGGVVFIELTLKPPPSTDILSELNSD